MRVVDDDTWTAIREAFETTSEPVNRIAARFEVARSTVQQRAMREGWSQQHRLRPSRCARRAGPPLPPPQGECVARETAEETARERRGDAPSSVRDCGDANVIPFLRAEADPPDVRRLRLFRIIDLQLDHMERQMTSDEPMSAQDQERQSRALGALMGNLEKASEASSEMDKTKPSGSEREDAHAKAEAERMRREIAARLERLSEQWKATLKPSE